VTVIGSITPVEILARDPPDMTTGSSGVMLVDAQPIRRAPGSAAAAKTAHGVMTTAVKARMAALLIMLFLIVVSSD
jgi:hypothetical protein